jgi:hypothetical protein
MTNARKGWDRDLRDGIGNEDRVEQLLRFGRIEIKLDEMSKKTNNLFLEFECSGIPSGIATTEAETWCISAGQIDLFVPTEFLKQIGRFYYLCGFVASGGDGDRVRGVLIPFDAFDPSRKEDYFDIVRFKRDLSSLPF